MTFHPSLRNCRRTRTSVLRWPCCGSFARHQGRAAKPAEKCELCSMPSAGRASSPGRSADAAAGLLLPAVRTALQRPAKCRLSPRAADVQVPARLPPLRRPVGEPADSHQPGVLLPERRSRKSTCPGSRRQDWQRSLPSIPVRQGRSNRCWGWRPGRRSWTTTRRWPTCSRKSRPCWSIASRASICTIIVPIDQCYRLSGLIRLHWRGLSGGSEVWEEVGAVLRPAEGEIVFDLNFQIESVAADRPRGVAAIGVPAGDQRNRGDGHSIGPAEVPDPHRADAAGVTRRRTPSGCWTCSGRPIAGARRCGACSGRTSRRSFRPSAGSTTVELAVPCSFDFNVAATKYFAAMEEGEIPLCFLFSGTVFYQAEDGRLQVAPISLDKAGRFPPARGRVEADDGPLLPAFHLALPRPGRLRSPLALQSQPRTAHLGKGDREPLGRQRNRRERGGVMNQAIVDKIVQAVLYEGYNLYPYRPSVKNRCRWTFGGLVPASLQRSQDGDGCLEHAGAMPASSSTTTAMALWKSNCGYLHLVAADDRRAAGPLRRIAGAKGSRLLQAVDSLLLGGDALPELAGGGGTRMTDRAAANSRRFRRGRQSAIASPSLPATGWSRSAAADGRIAAVAVRDQASIGGRSGDHCGGRRGSPTRSGLPAAPCGCSTARRWKMPASAAATRP